MVDLLLLNHRRSTCGLGKVDYVGLETVVDSRVAGKAQADYVRLEAARQEDRRRGREAAENAAAAAVAAPASPAGRDAASSPSDGGVVQLRVRNWATLYSVHSVCRRCIPGQ